jgi:phosphatidylserine/phosphatidylglycerophosphate/cardiolipin synthase-like enzyme
MGGGEGLVELARGKLLAQIRGARRRVWLVAPYLTGGVADEIIEARETSDAKDFRLITALTERSVRSRVLDPKALGRLHGADFRVWDLKDLHAKVSVVDDWGLVGSGNLTDSGIGEGKKSPNIELGVILAPPQVVRAAELIEHWWAMANEQSLDDFVPYEAMKPYPAPQGDIGKKGTSIGVLGTERLREILEEDPESHPERPYWIDPNYHDYRQEGWWRQRRWLSDWRDSRIKKDDLIVIYLAAHDGGPAKSLAMFPPTTASGST